MVANHERGIAAVRMPCEALGLEAPPATVRLTWLKAWRGRRILVWCPGGSLEAVIAWLRPLGASQLHVLPHARGIGVQCAILQPPPQWTTLVEPFMPHLRSLVVRLHGDGRALVAVGGQPEEVQRFLRALPHRAVPVGVGEEEEEEEEEEQEEEAAAERLREAGDEPSSGGFDGSVEGPAFPGARPPRLTRRQDIVLRESIRMGYYELPRRVHLRDIAKKMGTSVASLAEVLRRAEARLAERYQELPVESEPGGDGGGRAARARARETPNAPSSTMRTRPRPRSAP